MYFQIYLNNGTVGISNEHLLSVCTVTIELPKKHKMHIEPKFYKLNLYRKIGSLTWYQRLVEWEVMSCAITLQFACLEVFAFVSVSTNGIGLHMYIELKSCKPKLLGKLAIQ